MRRDEIELADPPSGDRPGEHWMCGAANGASPCARGPSAQGRCPMAQACRPQRTWQGRVVRLRWVALALIGTITLVSLQSWFAPAVYKPGQLSTPHAQILSGTLNSDRCAACHPAAVSPLALFRPDAEGHTGISQSDRCMDCHHTTIDRQSALLAHNVPAGARAALRVASVAKPSDSSWQNRLPGPSIDQDQVECSVCHKEHRGADGNLLNVANTKCQSCHHNRFGSFASAHPDWSAWPYGRGGQIAFDHATHAGKHFPATLRGGVAAEFRCADCHPRTSDQEIVRTAGYETACASCHDSTLKLEASQGLELLALPSLSTEAAVQIGNWPESATGFYDGKLAALTDLLMRSNPATAAALGRLPQRDFSQIDREDSRQVEAAQKIAQAHRELMKTIAANGQAALLDRLAATGIPPDTLADLVRSLPPQLIEDATRHWFSDQSEASWNAPQALLRRDGGSFSARLDRMDQADPDGPPPGGEDLLHELDDDLLVGDNGSDGVLDGDLPA
ncbi:MAG: hypothetical protein MI861_12960, partial [Pirellulales bacterium]|nr:hypothetical protein [Pirellulales bacterium]